MTIANSKVWLLVWRLWFFVLCATAPSVQARAQAVDPAQELFVEGLTEAKAGRLEHAVELFNRSRELNETANTLLNLAIMQSRLERYPDALRTLDALDARPDVNDDPTRVEKSQKLRARALAEVAEIELVITPSEATVTCDGLAMTPPIRVLPGSHVLRFSSVGFTEQQSTLTLASGERRRLQVSLQSVAQAPTMGVGEGDTARGPRVRTDSSAVIGGATDPARPDDARVSDRRGLRVALWVGAAVAVIAGGTAGVLWLTQDESTKPPAGEFPF